MKIKEFINKLEDEEYKIGDIREQEQYKKIMDKDVNVAIYARISKLTHKDTSVERQLEYMTMFLEDIGVNSNNINMYKDTGASGTDIERPGYKRLLYNIDTGKVNVIIVVNIDRFGRDCIEIVDKLYNLFKKKNILFISLDDMVVNSEEDRLEIIKKAVAAEEYCKLTSMKTRRGLKIRMKKGSYISSKPPYGYDKEEIPVSGHLQRKIILVVKEDNTPDIIRWIFNLYLKGNGYTAIANILNDEGILSPQNGQWNRSSIESILKNPIYAGILAQGRYRKNGYLNSGIQKKISRVADGDWIVGEEFEGIISKEFFYQVQEQMKNRNKYRKKEQPHVFTGILLCGECGKSLVYKKRDQGYKCSSSQNGNGCSSHFVKEKELLQLIKEQLEQFRYNKNRIIEHVKRNAEKIYNVDNIEERIKSIEKKIMKNDKKLINLYEEFTNDKLSERLYKLLTEEHESKIEELEHQIELLNIKQKEFYKINEEVIKVVDDFQKFEKIDNSILRLLVKKIIIFEDNNIEIIWNIKNDKALKYNKKELSEC